LSPVAAAGVGCPAAGLAEALVVDAPPPQAASVEKRMQTDSRRMVIMRSCAQLLAGEHVL
jgi:hypothetical protein